MRYGGFEIFFVGMQDLNFKKQGKKAVCGIGHPHGKYLKLSKLGCFYDFWSKSPGDVSAYLITGETYVFFEKYIH